MNNCQSCKYRQGMFNKLVGCSKLKKIIINPYEVKSCYKDKLNTENISDLINLFSKVGAEHG